MASMMTVGVMSTAVMPSVNQQRSLLQPPATTTVNVVECSSRPQKKATAHHMKTRPKKTQPWDVKRKGPTSYPPLPDLPADWTLVSSEEEPQQPIEVESDVVIVAE